MKKYYLLTIMALVLAALPARAAIYMVGNHPFGDWNPGSGIEMTAQGKIMGGRTYRNFEVYVSLAIIYWLITIIIEKGLGFVEKKLQIPEQVANYIPEAEKGVIEENSPAGMGHFIRSSHSINARPVQKIS